MKRWFFVVSLIMGLRDFNLHLQRSLFVDANWECRNYDISAAQAIRDTRWTRFTLYCLCCTASSITRSLPILTHQHIFSSDLPVFLKTDANEPPVNCSSCLKLEKMSCYEEALGGCWNCTEVSEDIEDNLKRCQECMGDCIEECEMLFIQKISVLFYPKLILLF